MTEPTFYKKLVPASSYQAAATLDDVVDAIKALHAEVSLMRTEHAKIDAFLTWFLELQWASYQTTHQQRDFLRSQEWDNTNDALDQWTQ